jgi:serine protease inhibitor
MTKAYQRTSFKFNRVGAELFVDSLKGVGASVDAPPKLLHFDKPFVIILKKETSQYPYFMMKVVNTELMVK